MSVQFSGDEEFLEKQSQLHGDEISTLFVIVEFFEKVNGINQKLEISFNQPVNFGNIQIFTNIFTILFKLSGRRNTLQTFIGVLGENVF